jgi:recombination protein RecA
MSRSGSGSAPASNGSPSVILKPKAPVEVKADGKGDVKNNEAKGAAKAAAAAAAGTPAATSPKPATPAPAPSKEKMAALTSAVSQIEKTFGKGSVMKLDENAYLAIPGLSTGAISLDLALGGKGIPRGRIIEIFGPESSGKTTLALTVAASAQREGGVAAFIDAEHALDPSWARRLGVNIDQLLVSQPDCGEQALEIAEMLARSSAVDLIVVDSVAALIPRAEIEGEMGDSVVGIQARLMSQAMRKLTGVVARSNCTVVFINQIREKIGVMYGSPETTPGGRALKFYASVRIDVRRIGAIKEGDMNMGNRTRARVVKNKVAPPFREAEFDIMFDEGISTTGDLLDMAVECNVVDKSGAWFNYGSVRLGQGRENAKRFLKENPDLFMEIRRASLKAKAVQPVKAAAVSEQEKKEAEEGGTAD